MNGERIGKGPMPCARVLKDLALAGGPLVCLQMQSAIPF